MTVRRITWKWRVLAKLLLALTVLWLVTTGVVAWKLTRRSAPLFAEPAPDVDWGPLEQHRLAAADGERIGAWLAGREDDRGCVLLLHGQGGCRSRELELMEFLSNQQLTVLTISLRGHGDSTGAGSDFGYTARQDVLAAVEFLEERFAGRPIYVVGRSLGAAAALFAAGDLEGRVAGYFLESPYKDLRAATWNRLRMHLPPVADRAAYAGVWLWSGLFLPVPLEEIAPYRHAARIPHDVPVVIVAGAVDRRNPVDEVKATFDLVRLHGKLVVFPTAAHNGLLRSDPDLYRRTLRAFLDCGAETVRQRPR